MNGFKDWLNGGNVINPKKNEYRTQCTQYTLPMTLLELKIYFVEEFLMSDIKIHKEDVKTYLKGEYEVSELEHKVTEANLEAEVEVVAEIQKDLLERMKLTHEEYSELVQQEVWETITEVFEFLEA
jgi:hypothetical protein